MPATDARVLWKAPSTENVRAKPYHKGHPCSRTGKKLEKIKVLCGHIVSHSIGTPKLRGARKRCCYFFIQFFIILFFWKGVFARAVVPPCTRLKASRVKNGGEGEFELFFFPLGGSSRLTVPCFLLPPFPAGSPPPYFFKWGVHPQVTWVSLLRKEMRGGEAWFCTIAGWLME